MRILGLLPLFPLLTSLVAFILGFPPSTGFELYEPGRRWTPCAHATLPLSLLAGTRRFLISRSSFPQHLAPLHQFAEVLRRARFVVEAFQFPSHPLPFFKGSFPEEAAHAIRESKPTPFLVAADQVFLSFPSAPSSRSSFSFSVRFGPNAQQAARRLFPPFGRDPKLYATVEPQMGPHAEPSPPKGGFPSLNFSPTIGYTFF